MWKIALFVALIVFVIADSVYLYFRLKKYWKSASWSQRSGHDSRKWKIGLSSLDIPLGKNTDKDGRRPDDV